MLLAIMLFVVVAISVVFFLYARSLRQAQKEQTQGEERFRQMAENIQEIFWMIDAETKKTLYVNQAYETVTGRSRESLDQNPTSYEEAIHEEDRSHVLASLEEATHSGSFDERFRIVQPTGELRWVWARGFPMRDADGNICRLVGTAQDITAQKQAEEQVAQNLKLAQSAWVEAEALRKATLSLVQDLRMDFVLDTVLQALTDLIECECARIWLLESETYLFVAREKLQHETAKKRANYPLTLNTADVPFLSRILANQKSVFLSDTKTEADWQTFKDHAHVRSWLCVPLIASRETLGLLSVGHSLPEAFTREDFRRAQLLAIPAAAAIQNARMYECASIYGAELERRISDLKQAKQALEQSEEGRRLSEEKFQTIFRSSPVAFSITTLDDGRFLDVNTAFERRYGYNREELLGHTVHELNIWENPADRARMLAELHKGVPIRKLVTRLRTKSGDVKPTVYSADKIQLDGQPCVLAVSEDLSE